MLFDCEKIEHTIQKRADSTGYRAVCAGDKADPYTEEYLNDCPIKVAVTPFENRRLWRNGYNARARNGKKFSRE